MRLRGWRELASEIDNVCDENPSIRTGSVLLTSGRTAASPLAFYLSDHPEMHVWNAGARIVSQYDVWGWKQALEQPGTMVITYEENPVPASLAEQFQSVRKVRTVEVPLGGTNKHQYTLWWGSQSPAAVAAEPNETTSRH